MKQICTFFLVTVVCGAAIGQPINRFELPFNYNFFLYPEIQYAANPAIAAALPVELDSYDVDVSYARAREQEDATGGNSGSFFSANHEVDLLFSYDGFRLIEPGVTLLAFLLDSTYTWRREEDDGLTVADVSSTQRSSGFDVLMRGDYLRARETENGASGWSAFLVGRWDPIQEEFARFTETGVNDDGVFFGPETGDRVIAGVLGGGAGLTRESAEGWRGLGVIASAGLTDRSGEFRTADTKGAGVNNEIVSESEFQTNDDWGAGNDLYEHRDSTISARVLASGALIRPLSDHRALILSGFLDLLDGTRRASYTHTNPDDQSREVLFRGALLSEGGIFAGIRRETEYGAELRYGLGLSGGARFRRENSVDADGESIFTAQNRAHLVESTATNPDNGDVISISGASNPSLTVDATLSFLGGLEWKLGPPVVLLLQTAASATADYDRYRYFDTTNDLVWTEWTLDHNLAVDLGVDFGVQFMLPNAVFITVSGGLPRLVDGSANLALDPLPRSPEGQSPGVSLPRETSNSQSINVAFEVVVRR